MITGDWSPWWWLLLVIIPVVRFAPVVLRHRRERRRAINTAKTRHPAGKDRNID